MRIRIAVSSSRAGEVQVHNPTAGDEEHDAERLCAVVAAHGHDVVYRSVKEDGWATALAEGLDLVVAAGGDGTVCEVFVAVAGTDVAATVLPLGSANNIAGTLGLADREVGALIRAWSEGHRRGFDLGEVSGRTRFVESFGGGIFARLIARADEDDGGDDKVDHGLHVLAPDDRRDPFVALGARRRRCRPVRRLRRRRVHERA